MPGYVIHMTEAKMILDILRKDSRIEIKMESQWQREFLYGSLLPDAGGKLQKQTSHFWNDSEIGKIIMTPDLNTFLIKYTNALRKHPLCGGYFAHLHLDRGFWKFYMKECIEFLDAAGKSTEYMKDLKSVFIKETKKRIFPEDFFSENYLYGDYTSLNKILVQKYDLEIPVYREYHNCEIEEADNKDMRRLLENLKKYMANSTVYVRKCNVLSLSTFELFLKKTAQQFAEWYVGYLLGG